MVRTDILGNRLWRGISLLLIFCARVAIPEPVRYWCSETNAVVAVSAYERERILPNGAHIRTFSTDIDSACTNYTAILFTVLHPKSMKGRFVLLSGPKDESGFGFVFTKRYEMDALYYIPLAALRKHGNEAALEPADFFRIGDTNSTLNVESQRLKEYYWNEDSAKQEVSKIRETINLYSNEVTSLSDYLRSHPRPERNDPRLKDWARMNNQYRKRIHSDLPSCQIQLNEVLWQIQQIHRLHEEHDPEKRDDF